MPWTAKRAVKEIRKRGGKLERHGAEHDYYRMPNGIPVSVPRHAGDLTKGVEHDIKKRIGYKD